MIFGKFKISEKSMKIDDLQSFASNVWHEVPEDQRSV